MAYQRQPRPNPAVPRFDNQGDAERAGSTNGAGPSSIQPAPALTAAARSAGWPAAASGWAARLRNFVDKAAQATLVGDVFDDAATGQGLLNYFL
ncbi:MAG TPA: hypothetical protein VF771_13280, partial [Longimicrobiaceae bacterium]